MAKMSNLVSIFPGSVLIMMDRAHLDYQKQNVSLVFSIKQNCIKFSDE
jgi:hypothetical protein